MEVNKIEEIIALDKELKEIISFEIDGERSQIQLKVWHSCLDIERKCIPTKKVQAEIRKILSDRKKEIVQRMKEL